MLMIFGDRATYDVDGDPVPVDELAVEVLEVERRRITKVRARRRAGAPAETE